MNKIETDCIRVMLKKVGPTFFKFMANGVDKGRFFLRTRIILFVTYKEMNSTLPFSSFKLVIN